ncbi:MAG: GAF domain-containing protein [Chloroflexaceae bacterium]|nr:GAF domain-containing protein [Chloroflexaceae bacterium]
MLQLVSGNTQRPAPSLVKLINTVPEAHRLNHPIDALVIIGRQLERIIEEDNLPAAVSMGTLRFSLFRIHQERIARMAKVCQSVRVYGEADIAPPNIPGIEFIALPEGSPLAREWFFSFDSPGFWGALITQLIPNRDQGSVRRYLFEGALSADERIVTRIHLLLSLLAQRPAPHVAERDVFANSVRWARFAFELAAHSEAERLNLMAALGEVPILREVLALYHADEPQQSFERMMPQALHELGRLDVRGAVLYKVTNNTLHPHIWHNTDGQPLPVTPGQGISGQAFQQRTPVLSLLSTDDPEYSLLHEAHSVVAVPILVNDAVWGVLSVGQLERDPYSSPAAAGVISVAALLEQVAAATPTPSNWMLPETASPPASFGTSRLVDPTPPPPPVMPKAASPAPPVPTPAVPPQPSTSSASAFGLPAWMQGATAAPPPPPAAPVVQPAEPVAEDIDWDEAQRRLAGALVAFDRRMAEYIWQEMIAKYTSEEVCTKLLMPVQVAVGEGWHRGEVSVAAEHFTSRFTESKMIQMLHAIPDKPGAPTAVIGCVQGEMHELGAMMLGLFLAWEGFRVIYLGQNVPNTTLAETIRQLRPQVIGLSATTVESAHNLTEAGQIITRIEPPRPQFIFGGSAFYERPDLKARIHGQFLEGDVRLIARDLAAKHLKV